MVFIGISNIHKGKLLIYEKQLHLLSVLPWTLSPVCFIKCRYFLPKITSWSLLGVKGPISQNATVIFLRICDSGVIL